MLSLVSALPLDTYRIPSHLHSPCPLAATCCLMKHTTFGSPGWFLEESRKAVGEEETQAVREHIVERFITRYVQWDSHYWNKALYELGGSSCSGRVYTTFRCLLSPSCGRTGFVNYSPSSRCPTRHGPAIDKSLHPL